MKSVENLFHEAMAAVDKAGRRRQYNDKAKGCTTIETKLNCAEAVLAEAGIVRESRANITGRAEEPTARVTVKKNNGRADNYVEGNAFGPTKTELLVESFSPGYINLGEATPEALERRLTINEANVKLRAGVITEAEHKKLTETRADGVPAGLTNIQALEYKHARAIGLNEAQALKLAKMPHVYRGVQR